MLHILFWVAYTIQDSIMMYSWTEVAMPHLTLGQSSSKAILAAIIILLPKLIFTYYLLEMVIPQILAGTVRWVNAIIGMVLVMAVCVVLYRALFNYLIYPYVYDGVMKTAPLLRVINLFQSAIDIGFISGAAVIFRLLRVQLASKEREKDLVREKLETELKFLRNQTNPHFLFNTLNNIYGLARRKSDDTAEVVMKLSKLLRFMLYESKEALIPIGEEIRMLDNFINLEQIRYSRKLTLEYEKKLDDETEPVAPLLLLPLVENAFKHGVSENRFESLIRIKMELQNGILNLSIENSREPSPGQDVREGIGLRNVRRQLELMYREYDLQVREEEKYFSVLLTINLRSHEKI